MAALKGSLCSVMQVGNASACPPHQAWLTLDLFVLFSQLYDEGHAPAVHQILELPKAECPAVLVLSTASALRCSLRTFYEGLSFAAVTADSSCIPHQFHHVVQSCIGAVHLIFRGCTILFSK